MGKRQEQGSKGLGKSKNKEVKERVRDRTKK
jgi:hypothetical protein